MSSPKIETASGCESPAGSNEQQNNLIENSINLSVGEVCIDYKAAASEEYRKENIRRPYVNFSTVEPSQFTDEDSSDDGWGIDDEDLEQDQEAISDNSNVIDAPEFSEETLASQFAAEHSYKLRYVKTWRQWFVWDGCRWKVDQTSIPVLFSRSICKAEANRTKDPRLCRVLASAKTIYAVANLATTDEKIAVTTDHWDRDYWLLNTPDGTVDLRDGTIKPPDPNDYITKVTAVSPKGECPQFLAFLDQIFEGDQELIDYMQRVLGYCLTGVTREHAMFFGYGKGGNGKGVLVKTIADILGDYHRSSGIETFTVSKSDRHPTDLANLRGARFVTSTETEQGRHWAESRIKQLTGGDHVSARFMRSDFFDFIPKFKLFITGNHKPKLSSVDGAIKRRFNLIPFGVTIEEDEKDTELPEKLRDEWGGILLWAVQGCLEWQRIGLQPPQAVCKATDEYLKAEDSFGAWLTSWCETGLQYKAQASSLLESYIKFLGDNSSDAINHISFAKEMSKRGITDKRFNSGKYFIGIRLRPSVLNDSGELS
jgi:putative DNA primase/helicase